MWFISENKGEFIKSMISKKDIDIAFNYYKIDFKYKKRCYKCAKKK